MHITNTSNLPVESLEMEYPLLVDEYALVEDSGGAGRFRGGHGHPAHHRGARARGELSRLARAGARIAPWGLLGGGPGGRGAIVLNPEGSDERALPSKVWGYRLAPAIA